jgi:hypothetical protein
MKTITKFTSSSLKGMRFMKSSYLIAALFLLANVGGAAQPEIRPPVCPGPDCQKVITFHNNFTDHAVFPVIQAGIQNPDPWLQALFNNSSQPYAETHYSRVYINPVHGIPPGGHVSVTVPWYSKLQNDPDTYADWYNGGRIVLFDTKQALDMATAECDRRHPERCSKALQFTADSPPISCDGCSEPLTFYKAGLAYDPKYPFQLVEYTFADVATPPGRTPFIIDLNVGYNVSFLDQIYLPVALEPCRTEPCNSPDPSAFGYLGTTKALSDFRMILTNFSNNEGWPRYLPVSRIEDNPRLPGTYDVLVDKVNVIEKGQPSHFTPSGASVRDLIAQWNTCTTGEDRVNCPEYAIYQEINNYFKGNYANYKAATNAQCPPSSDYPRPTALTSLNIMPYVYGWVPFNSGCGPAGAAFNGLLTSPGPPAAFDQALFNYVHRLQYNYRSVVTQKRFNPFVDLVHNQLKANGYAFSVDDAISFENHPGQGLIIAIGGATGLPNPLPVVPPPNYTVDFSVSLGDSIAQHRPRWKSFGVCKEVADTDFPPLPPNPTVDNPQIIVDSADISPTNPCTITVTDANNRVYQFRVDKKVPWPTHNPPGVDPGVLTCRYRNDGWCIFMNELAKQAPNPQFVLFTPPPLP